MDALALLCNLYGDGPSTLKRLRAHGVQRIEDLSGRQAGDLALLLALSAATARRFLKEATALESRVLDSRAGAPEEDLPEPAAVKRAARAVVNEDERREAPPKLAAVKRAATRGKDALLAAAARRWDELDRTSSLFPATQSDPAPSTSSDHASGLPLAAAELDRAIHDALDAIGVHTLDELARLEADALATASGLGISQVLFAQGMARRKAREQDERIRQAASGEVSEGLSEYVMQPGSHCELRFSPTERPPAEWLSAGADQTTHASFPALDEGAGPFA